MKPYGYHLGDWLATCFECNRKMLASTLKKHWRGYYVCEACWESRHPQDFVRGVPESPAPPWTQPQWEHDIDIHICDLNGRSAIPGYAMPGCSIPGYEVFDPSLPSPEIPEVCNIFTSQGVPGWGVPGCAIPGHDPFVA